MMAVSGARRMGQGYEPHVDEVNGRLLYSLPVDSSFVSTSFSFAIGREDLDVLLSDPYRRAVLEVVAHTKLQRSMIRGNPPVTESDFARIVAAVLHASPAELRDFVAAVDHDHNMRTEFFVRAILARRSRD